MKTIHFSLVTIPLILANVAFAQGSLAPPGAPKPTMKTLEQIEPRIDLQHAPASVVTTTNPDYHFIITQPGSYYLSANLGVTKPNGIQINAEGVTMDLNGFEISRPSGSGGSGIEIPVTSPRTSVRNGSLNGFAYGIRSLFFAGYALACAFHDLSVSNCTSGGIRAGEGAVLESCRAYDNSGFDGLYAHDGSLLTDCTATSNTVDYGIFTASGSSLTNCTATSNTATYGIFAGGGSSLTNCTAALNTSAATTSAGIGTGSGCTISHCTAISNTSTAGTSTPTTGMGFDVSSGNTIHGSTAFANEDDGIKISNDSHAHENTCKSNGISGDGAGIHATGSDNRIEGNNVTDNDRGIDVDTAGNLILKNSAANNTTNYDIAANNVFGAIVNRTAPGLSSRVGQLCREFGWHHRSLGEFQLLSQPAFLSALTRTERSYGLEGPETNGERLDIAPRWGAGICL